MASSTNAPSAAGSGAIYCLGIFGAWFYFWQQADGFWEHVYAIFEGVFWPAYLVFQALEALKA
ncbi:MAG TPA: hypothetical protein VFJ89_00345 [Nocardioides sp.]|jgi:hypothetical protein|nr:hypothetical protein [Nocardioides sp.]